MKKEYKEHHSNNFFTLESQDNEVTLIDQEGNILGTHTAEEFIESIKKQLWDSKTTFYIEDITDKKIITKRLYQALIDDEEITAIDTTEYCFADSVKKNKILINRFLAFSGNSHIQNENKKEEFFKRKYGYIINECLIGNRSISITSIENIDNFKNYLDKKQTYALYRDSHSKIVNTFLEVVLLNIIICIICTILFDFTGSEFLCISTLDTFVTYPLINRANYQLKSRKLIQGLRKEELAAPPLEETKEPVKQITMENKAPKNPFLERLKQYMEIVSSLKYPNYEEDIIKLHNLLDEYLAEKKSVKRDAFLGTTYDLDYKYLQRLVEVEIAIDQNIEAIEIQKYENNLVNEIDEHYNNLLVEDHQTLNKKYSISGSQEN